MQVRIQNKSHSSCTVRIPASKSLSHRALIASSLADGTSHLLNLTENQDIQATMHAMQQLGAEIHQDGDQISINGIRNLSCFEPRLIDCSESGSTLRFLIPLFSLTGKRTEFTGHGRLMSRPLDVYESMFRDQGLLFEQQNGKLTIEGKLRAGEYTLRGDVSSQFISGMLMALPLNEDDSILHVLSPYESKSYVALTEDVLSLAGIRIEDHGSEIVIPGHQHYHPLDYCIDGDDSQASFFLALACTGNKQIEVQGMRHDSRQGDHSVIEIMRRMGAKIEETRQGYSSSASLLHGVEVDLENCPDLGPILFALATQAEGETVFVHAERLRMKESDRIACMEEELSKLGCSITSECGIVRVNGRTPIQGGITVDGHNDHRIVMALSILALSAKEPVIISGAEAVRKSYPGFFEDLNTLGVEAENI